MISGLVEVCRHFSVGTSPNLEYQKGFLRSRDSFLCFESWEGCAQDSTFATHSWIAGIWTYCSLFYLKKVFLGSSKTFQLLPQQASPLHSQTALSPLESSFEHHLLPLTPFRWLVLVKTTKDLKTSKDNIQFHLPWTLFSFGMFYQLLDKHALPLISMRPSDFFFFNHLWLLLSFLWRFHLLFLIFKCWSSLWLHPRTLFSCLPGQFHFTSKTVVRNYWVSTLTRICSKSFNYIFLFNPHNSPLRQVQLLFPFCRSGNWSIANSSNIWVHGRVRIWTQSLVLVCVLIAVLFTRWSDLFQSL